MKKYLGLSFICTLVLFVSCDVNTPEGSEQDYKKSGKHRGHEYVDLGLSIRWATCNIGANSLEEYGDYFAWGEVETKETYDSCTYKHVLERYGNISEDNKIYMLRKFDAAAQNWGGNWRMPTHEEFMELCNWCQWKKISVNGVNGYKVTGPSGKSIFLPSAGCKRGNEHVGASLFGRYWSNTSYAHTDVAISLFTDITGEYFVRDFVYEGLTVRPVCP